MYWVVMNGTPHKRSKSNGGVGNLLRARDILEGEARVCIYTVGEEEIFHYPSFSPSQWLKGKL